MDHELMKRLSEADGVSSQEAEVAAIMETEFRKRGLKTEADSFGNVLAYKSVGKNPLILGAHMDEIGLMVKHIDEKGFLRFIKIGGIDDRTLVNQQVMVRTAKGLLPGVIGNKPPHIMRDEERKSAIDFRSLFIDVGATSAEEARKMGLEIGNTVTFPTGYRKLGPKMISGKALDNRIGCYVLLHLAEGLPDNVILIGTSQEEVSTFGKGAATASYKLHPRAFIAVDTAVAGDHPELKPDDAPVHLGKGPSVVLVEAGARGNVAEKKLAQKVLEIAKKAKVDVQLEVIDGGATDAASVHNILGGIPSIGICVPTRYIHSTVAVAHEDDIESDIKLLKKLIGEL
ncbi:MAG TPA: M42 family metallopeptidase [Candidatus Bilamarchaeum sp.]|nr:M42 family metallopeptidase [Candidatus Bilamarchaeum sp.]